MLTAEDYEALKPYRDNLMEGNANHAALKTIDPIRTRLGYGSICFDCSGSIANAVRDIQELIQRYEKTNNITL